MRGPARALIDAFFLSIIHAIVFLAPAFSQTTERQEIMLEEVTVTATRLERQSLDVPASVEVADAEAIKDANMFNCRANSTGPCSKITCARARPRRPRGRGNTPDAIPKFSFSTPGGQTRYVNSGKTIKKGLEISAAWFVLSDLEVGGAYSYADYTFDDFTEPVDTGGATVDVDRGGNRLPYVPEDQFSLFVSYRHGSGIRLRMETLYWGSYYIDNANSEKYEGYAFVTNAMAAYARGDFEISLNAENLFDDAYATEVEKDTRGVVRYTPAAPRHLMLRLTYRL